MNLATLRHNSNACDSGQQRCKYRGHQTGAADVKPMSGTFGDGGRNELRHVSESPVVDTHEVKAVVQRAGRDGNVRQNSCQVDIRKLPKSHFFRTVAELQVRQVIQTFVEHDANTGKILTTQIGNGSENLSGSIYRVCSA
ncbi:hypothetical protein D3C87_1468610 [compost metagenome]